MTVAALVTFAQTTFERSLRILAVKGPDYAPEDIILLDVIADAISLNVTPDKILYLMLQKHLTAIRRHCVSGAVASEPFGDRIADAINFLILLKLLDARREEIYRSALTYLKTSPEHTHADAEKGCIACHLVYCLEDWLVQLLPLTPNVPDSSHGVGASQSSILSEPVRVSIQNDVASIVHGHTPSRFQI